MIQSERTAPESRRDRLIRERTHDPYKLRGKLLEPTRCPQCGAVYHRGRWSWTNDPGEGAQETLCQACRRVADGYPAGELRMAGKFLAQHKEEILNLAHNTEQIENLEHPLNRIIEILEHDGELIITTTDIHLPRRIGQAISNAWGGEFDMHYDEEGYFIRLNWRRE